MGKARGTEKITKAGKSTSQVFVGAVKPEDLVERGRELAGIRTNCPGSDGIRKPQRVGGLIIDQLAHLRS